MFPLKSKRSLLKSLVAILYIYLHINYFNWFALPSIVYEQNKPPQKYPKKLQTSEMLSKMLNLRS